MLQMFTSLLKVIFDFLKYPFYVILFCFVVFLVFCSYFVIIKLLKGNKMPKIGKGFVHKSNLLVKLFWEVPKQFIEDLFSREPDFFTYQGLVIFEGRQGNGKTIGMTQFINTMQTEFPKSKTITNYNYTKQDKNLKDWRDLIDYKNGKKGVIVGMDELQNWFSCNDSKNFPPEMLGVITQNRKNRRIILGTSQNFYLLSKAIRSQATEVRRCATLLGCLTIVRRYEPILDSEGNVVKFKYKGMYCFVHDKELRNSYDTWKTIENLKKSGFIDNPATVVENTQTNNFIVKNKKIAKKLTRR